MSSTLDISQLRTDIRLHCGVVSTTPGFDDTGCDLLANRALWAIINKFPFREKEKVSTFPTVDGSATYVLPTLFEAIRFVSIEDPDSKAHNLLERMTRKFYEEVYTNTDASEAAPEKYFRDGACIGLWPTPDKAYPITIGFWITLAQIDDSNPNFPYPANWYEIIMYGSVERGYLQLRNTEESAKWHNLQAAGINDSVPIEAKEEIDSSYSGVRVHGYNPNNIYDS